MKKKVLLSAFFVILSFLLFAQSWQDNIDNINNYTKKFDPYYRKFSFNPATYELKFVTSDGDITCKLNIKNVKYFKEPNGDRYYLTFECKDGSTCINSDYSGNLKATSITITNGNVVDYIIDELDKIAAYKAPGTSTVTTSNSSWQTTINQINSYTKLYDPYKRFFSYNPSKKELTWVTDEGDITCKAILNKVKVYVNDASGSYMVTFKTLDDSKTIDCNYGGATNLTAITMTNKEYANKVVELILSLSSSPSQSSSSGSYSTTYSKIERVNELCRKYDEYIRKFSYNESNGMLTWINKEGDITCKAYLSEIYIEVREAGSEYSIRFTCSDNSKCVDCNYTGPVDVSAITVSDKAAANEIKELISSIPKLTTPAKPTKSGSRLTEKISN